MDSGQSAHRAAAAAPGSVCFCPLVAAGPGFNEGFSLVCGPLIGQRNIFTNAFPHK